MEKGQTEIEEKTETGRANYGSRKIYKNRLAPRNVAVRRGRLDPAGQPTAASCPELRGSI